MPQVKPHVRGVVLEGLSYAGKTSTLKALKRAQAKRENSERSVLVLGEHYSQQLQTVDGELTSLTCDEHAELLDDRIGCIEKLNNWAIHLGAANRSSRGLFFVLERFHLNHRFAYAQSVHIDSIEERLSDLGSVCFLLTVSSSHIHERIQHREKESISQNNIDHVCHNWIKAQERLIALSHKSLVPTTIVETDERIWDTYANRIMNLMDE